MIRSTVYPLGLLAVASGLDQSSTDPRTIRVVNSCEETGWIIVTDGYGSTHPDLATYRLNSSESVDFTWASATDAGVVWSGNLALCLEGTCGPPPSTCDAGGCYITEGGPLSRAEFTIATGVDYYDVSIINGANVPVSITPVGTLSAKPEDAYWCGNPGGATPLTAGVAGASWAFAPPFPEYYTWVLAGGSTCATDADCADGGGVCGLSNAVGNSSPFSLTCGAPGLGHWTADQICGADRSMGFPFNCSEPMQNGPTGADTMWTYLGCTDGISSCYSSGAPDSCCGCFNWWEEGVPVPPAPATTACANVNAEWVGSAGSTLRFLKAGCPTCYTYPYDDVSSTFLCNSQGDGAGPTNAVDYVVEFCPEAQ